MKGIRIPLIDQCIEVHTTFEKNLLYENEVFFKNVGYNRYDCTRQTHNSQHTPKWFSVLPTNFSGLSGHHPREASNLDMLCFYARTHKPTYIVVTGTHIDSSIQVN